MSYKHIQLNLPKIELIILFSIYSISCILSLSDTFIYTQAKHMGVLLILFHYSLNSFLLFSHLPTIFKSCLFYLLTISFICQLISTPKFTIIIFIRKTVFSLFNHSPYMNSRVVFLNANLIQSILCLTPLKI